MIEKRSTWVSVIFVWTWISGFYLEGEGFAWSTVVGTAISYSLFKILQNHPQPVLTKAPSKEDPDGEGDIDFAKLEGFVPPERRRPLPPRERKIDA